MERKETKRSVWQIVRYISKIKDGWKS